MKMTLIVITFLLLSSSPVLTAEFKPKIGQHYWITGEGEFQGENIGAGSDRWLRILRDLGPDFDTYVVEFSTGKKIQVRRFIIDEGLMSGSITTYDPIRMRIATIKSKGWPTRIEKAIFERKIILDMTKEQVELSWGKPERINRSGGSWGISEQWVYEGQQYLYFQNGKLTSWQDSK